MHSAVLQFLESGRKVASKALEEVGLSEMTTARRKQDLELRSELLAHISGSLSFPSTAIPGDDPLNSSHAQHCRE